MVGYPWRIRALAWFARGLEILSDVGGVVFLLLLWLVGDFVWPVLAVFFGSFAVAAWIRRRLRPRYAGLKAGYGWIGAIVSNGVMIAAAAIVMVKAPDFRVVVGIILVFSLIMAILCVLARGWERTGDQSLTQWLED